VWYLIGIASGSFFGWLGYRFSKRRKLAAFGGVLFGLAAASYFAPHDDYSQGELLPLVHIDVPLPFRHDTVIFIVDPKAANEIVWSKDGEGHVTAPKSGIIRMKSLGPLEHHESHALLLDGRRDWEMFDSYLADGTNFLLFGFTQEGTQPSLSLMSDAEVAEYLRKREAER
jgi:hypothetical protein